MEMMKKGFKAKFKIAPENFGLGVTANGRLAWDIDDEVARELRGLTLEEVYTMVCIELCDHGFKSMSRHFKRWFGNYELATRWNPLYIEGAIKERFGRHNNGLQRAWLGDLVRKTRARVKKI